MVQIFAYAVFTVFFLGDIYIDLQEQLPLSHVWHEVVMFAFSLAALSWQVWMITKKNRHIRAIHTELLEAKKSYLEWKERSKASAGAIREMIDEQLGQWQLSQSEKDVALFLIKGLSMKEIAEIRQTQEKTVRTQATTIYRKSGLSGRQELAAFFLEDILSLPD